MRYAQLGDLGEFKNGVNFKSEQMGRGVPLINVKDITGSHRINSANLDRVEIETNDKMFAKEGGIFFVRSSVKLDGIALSAKLVSSDSKTIHCGFVIRFRPTVDELCTDYLLYLLRSHEYRERLKGLSGGAAIVNISQSVLKRLSISLPSLPQQERIASILSTYDDLIENNRRRIQLLEQAARLLYREWFVHLRFPGHEHATITDGVPEGWTPTTIADIGCVVTGKTPSKKMESYYGDDIPFIKTPDMHGNTLVSKTDESLSVEGANTQANKTLPPRSILVSCIGTVGVVAFNSSIAQTNQQINAIAPINESLRYWTFFMAKDLKPLLEGMSGGATMANVNKSKFSSIKVVIPSSLMLDQFNSFVAIQVDQIEQLALMNLQLTQARDLLLPRLMNGDVTV